MGPSKQSGRTKGRRFPRETRLQGAIRSATVADAAVSA